MLGNCWLPYAVWYLKALVFADSYYFGAESYIAVEIKIPLSLSLSYIYFGAGTFDLQH